MHSPSPLRPSPTPGDAAQALLAHFPPEVPDAFHRLQTGDPSGLDVLVTAVVRDHMPDRARASTALISDETALVEDLGFDSMAISETVFFFEDLFQVAISNEEIQAIRTVGDLRTFMARKLAGG